MFELLDWWNRKSRDLSPVISSSILHYRFEAIYLFDDGNGRTGRALAALGVPLGQVLASPVFRARDTAELAFGARAVVEPLLTADDYTPDAAQLARQIAWLRARTGRPGGRAAFGWWHAYAVGRADAAGGGGGGGGAAQIREMLREV